MTYIDRIAIQTMVLLWVGNSETARTCESKQSILKGETTKFATTDDQVPWTDQITDVSLDVCTYFWVTIWYKYDGSNNGIFIRW